MSVLRYVRVAVVACGAVACIVIGIDWIDPPDRGGGEETTGFALLEAGGILLGWGLIGLGGLLLCGAALALVFGRRARARRAARVDQAPRPLPEARVHVRSPGEGSVETRRS